LRVIVPGAGDEPNDPDAHAHPSHTAIAISPTSASEIRYAVIGFPPEKNLRHDRHVRIISGANLIPIRGPRAVVDLGPRRVPPRSRVPAN